jgi:hypothetical protein
MTVSDTALSMTLEVLKAVRIWAVIFWVVTPCSPVGGHESLQTKRFLQNIGKLPQDYTQPKRPQSNFISYKKFQKELFDSRKRHVFFSSLTHPYRRWDPPTLVSNEYWGHFPVFKHRDFTFYLATPTVFIRFQLTMRLEEHIFKNLSPHVMPLPIQNSHCSNVDNADKRKQKCSLLQHDLQPNVMNIGQLIRKLLHETSTDTHSQNDVNTEGSFAAKKCVNFLGATNKRLTSCCLWKKRNRSHKAINS